MSLSLGDGIAIAGVSAPLLGMLWTIVHYHISKKDSDKVPDSKQEELEAELAEAKTEALRTALLSEITKLGAEILHLKEKTSKDDLAVKQRIDDLETRVEKILDIIISLLKED